LPLPLVEFVPSYHRRSIAAERLVVVLRQNIVGLVSAIVSGKDHQGGSINHGNREEVRSM
jgi:hypothetical protein